MKITFEPEYADVKRKQKTGNVIMRDKPGVFLGKLHTNRHDGIDAWDIARRIGLALETRNTAVSGAKAPDASQKKPELQAEKTPGQTKAAQIAKRKAIQKKIAI